LNANKIFVAPVQGRRALEQFIRLPWSIYGNDPVWVPPLLLERRQHLSPRNPFFKHARWQAWLAYRDGEPVGRISAQIDRLYQQHQRNDSGFFGLLETEDNSATVHALLETAETWLRTRGQSRILGPFNLSINDECGLLVDGFETPPNLMMGHARPYYATRLEEQGYTPAQDLLAYRIQTDFTPPPAMRMLTAKMAGALHIRPLNRRRLADDLRILCDIFNDAWAENWGFTPFTEAEFMLMGRDLAKIADDDFVQVAEVDGTPAAMIVLLPNLNEIIRDLNGRLLPWGWLRLLWRFRYRYPTTARIPLMGVRRQYQQQLLGTALAVGLIETLRTPAHRRGIESVELSWILESNAKMRHLIETLGGVCYKRYRIYQKTLQ